MGREDDGHLAKTLGADKLQRFEDVAFVFDPEFWIRFDAEDAFSEGDLPDFTTDARLREFLFNFFDFRTVRWREQHFHTIEPA